MSSSYSESYSFTVRGTANVPQPSHWHYGKALYDREGKEVSLPALVEARNVPRKVEYEREVTVDIDVDGRPFDRGVATCQDRVSSLTDGVDGLTGRVKDLTGDVKSLTRESDTLTDNVKALAGKVNGLTATVVTLTGETVRTATSIADAKAEAADTIANSLISGFSFYVHRMVADKIRELRATIPGKASTFGALSKSLNERSQNLKDDYERITKRYTHIIEQLNENLEGRLRELDRPAFDNCAEMTRVIFQNPFGLVLGQSVCSGGEQIQTAAAVKISHVKDATDGTMLEVAEFVKKLRRLSRTVSGTLTEHRGVAARRALAMPVVRIECDGFESSGVAGRQLHMPQGFSLEHGGDQLERIVVERLDGMGSVAKSEVELQSIDGCFRQRVTDWVMSARSTGGRDARVVEKIVELWERSKDTMRS